MSGAAIAMMLVAMVVIWGGMIASGLYLRAHPEGSVQLLDEFGRPVDHPMLDVDHPES
ncbi:methionine/alanine import family NSS transporter small subunit [Ancrocorticia populi]|uniref:Putative methionine/alanine importer small subunit n=1 Tax=Ancrocorticia populi TaxID=2175228 RepID=A0A2V1KA18_9ACTO|nr:methionine/alanine import family NSS transporter small subunit [Ancrocorticia populi]MDN6485916.1 methionine/alanine import family NSS transporter small subunit [Ancrocorticia sp.]PWF27150.1 putative methionine/alanine importer small subunit [Ancrocorticia populi]